MRGSKKKQSKRKVPDKAVEEARRKEELEKLREELRRRLL